MSFLSISNSSFKSFLMLCIFKSSISIVLLSFLDASLVNICTSIIVPFIPWGTFKEESLTSDAFSPKIACNNFSSGVSCTSLFLVTLPTNISPVVTCDPKFTIPHSSNFFNDSLFRLGISDVISSGPSFKSLAIHISSSMCILVNLFCFIFFINQSYLRTT